MKTKRSVLSIAFLLLAACGDKADDSNGPSTGAGDPRDTRDGFLLTTELPPELIEGTPKPIRIPGVRPLPRPRPAPMERTAPPPPATRPARAVTQAPAPAIPKPSAAPVRPTENFRPPAESCADSIHPLPPGQIQPPPTDRERYGQLIDNPWQAPVDAPLSTFSIDVDTASYSNLRSMAARGARIPKNSVRLEEIVNYFDYSYAPPTGEHPFAVHIDNAACPWNPDNQIVRVALKGPEIDRDERAPANLVFLLDVSGSMRQSNKLPLVIQSFQLLLEELNPSDTITIVVYAGSQGIALPPTVCDPAGRDRIASALQNLRAGGSTNGAGGIQLAYQLAREHFKPGGINRVILATDGDFNVGVTDDGGLVGLVETGDGSQDPPVEKLRYQTDPQPASEIDPAEASAEWLTVKLRYKQPEEDHSSLIEIPFTGISRELVEAGDDFRFAASAAMTAMLLRDAEGLESSRFDHAVRLATGAIGDDPHGLRAEFVQTIDRLAGQTRHR